MTKASAKEIPGNVGFANYDDDNRGKPLRFRYRALLLLGPTGSGKTPLGDLIERNGVWGEKCVHFDFGAELRKIAAAIDQSAPPGIGSGPFTDKERNVIFRSLAAGELLENENFPIAQKILVNFIEKREFRAAGLLVLNGLPRHIGQARDLEKTVDMRAVVYLECSADVIRERIRLDSGGDRAGRPDDSLEALEKKFEIFEDRTLPLLEFYQSRKARVLKIPVFRATRAQDILKQLD